MRRSTMLGASRVPLGVTTNTSDRCRRASRSTSCPSRQGRAAARCIHGWSLVTPRARRPNTATTPKAARTTSSMVAPVSEPVTASRITQHAATPPAIFHRFRLRGDSEARAGGASLPRAHSSSTVPDYVSPACVHGPDARAAAWFVT